jgi:hypothetical protein
MNCFTSTKVQFWEKESEFVASQTGWPFKIEDVKTQRAKSFCKNLAQKFGYDLTYEVPTTAVFKK